jgi:hypothetical protein
MRAPQGLRLLFEHHDFTRLPPWMIRREAFVVRGMPVLRGHHQLETAFELVRNRDDDIALRHRHRSVGQKIILQIYEHQHFHLVDQHNLKGHGREEVVNIFSLRTCTATSRTKHFPALARLRRYNRTSS